MAPDLALQRLQNSSERMNADVSWTKNSRNAAEVHHVAAATIVEVGVTMTGAAAVVMGHVVGLLPVEEATEAEADGGRRQ